MYNHKGHLHITHKPKFYGSKILSNDTKIDSKNLVELAFDYINTNRLFQVGFGYSKKNQDLNDYDKLIKNVVYPKYVDMKHNILENKLIEPILIYGYFETYTDTENDTLFFIDENKNRVKIPLRRMIEKSNKSIVDFFEAKGDFLGFSLVSLGFKYDSFVKGLYERDEYQDYYFYHALGTHLADHFADILEYYMKVELFGECNKKLGSRYSFGYKALPNLEGNKIIYDALKVSEKSDILISDSYMFEPELTTGAIISFCEDAHYFSS